MTASTSLQALVGRGLAWSALSSLVLRVGNFLVGIFLARILAPEQFGVFAVALTVQTVLMTLADLGMSTDLIRSENPALKAPTVATLAAASGAALSALMASSSQNLADLLGSEEAGPVIAVMSLSLLLAGLGVVPYASLQRKFEQKKLFIVALADFVVGNVFVVVLVLAGWGVMALAVGRLIAQALALVLQFIVSGEKIRFGYDPVQAPGVLRFGLPVAGANLISWSLLNIDNVAVSRLAGPTALGFYFLAFNISNWPMSALGQVVRAVSIPAFAQTARTRDNKALAAVTGPVSAASLLAGLLLAVLAQPIVEILYGPLWLPAANILVWLALFGAIRTVFDLAASYLLAWGAAKAAFLVQTVWICTLGPAVFIGVRAAGPVGVAIAHITVAVFIVLPAYGLALRRTGTSIALIASRVWPPVVAALPAAGAAAAAMAAVPTPIGRLLTGGAAACIVYALMLALWLWRRVYEARAWLSESSTSTTVINADPAGRLPRP